MNSHTIGFAHHTYANLERAEPKKLIDGSAGAATSRFYSAAISTLVDRYDIPEVVMSALVSGCKNQDEEIAVVSSLAAAIDRYSYAKLKDAGRERGERYAKLNLAGARYGYGAVAGGRVLLPIPSEIKVLVMVAKFINEPTAEIVRRLNASGLRTRSGTTWNTSNVRTVLTIVEKYGVPAHADRHKAIFMDHNNRDGDHGEE